MPTLNPSFTSTPVISFAIIGTANQLLDTSQNARSAWSWGTNSNGILGDNTTTDRSSPVSVVGAHSFINFSLGVGTTNALKPDGTIWSWGINSSGECGDNTATTRSSPVSVVGAHSFLANATGGNHGLALKADGSAWAWGAAASGVLGDNQTATNRSSPTSVLGAHSFVQTAAGNVHSLALKQDNGTVWVWGLGTSGQCGDNTAASKSSPVSVLGAHSFNYIASGNSHCLGLKANNGTAWSWGLNTSGGQIGDNSAANRSSPTSVVGAHSFVQIAGGNTHSVALKQDGTVWTWGTNTSGQIGDNTATDRSSPVSIVGGHAFINIAAGQNYSIALKADGSTWTWGLATNGRLGDNQTSASRSSPVSVVGVPKFSILKIGPVSTSAGALRYDYAPYTNIFTAGVNGSRIENVLITALETVADGCIRFFIYDGTNQRLFKEVSVPATTVSTVSTWSTTVQFSLDLPTGYSILAATHNANAFSLTLIGGNY